MGMQAAAQAAGGLWDRVIKLAESADEADWHRPTPCTEWDVADLLAHLSGIQTALDGIPQPPLPEGWEPPPGAPLDAWTAAGVAARRGWSRTQLLDELGAARDSHVSRLETADPHTPTTGPIGQTTEEGLFRIRAWDIWVHLQDLTEALGQPPELDDDSAGARAAHEYIVGLLPWMFAKRVAADEKDAVRFVLSAPLDRDQVLVITDGRARWTEPNGDVAGIVSAKPAALSLLASGRGSPERWRSLGALDWSGDLGQAMVDRARMF